MFFIPIIYIVNKKKSSFIHSFMKNMVQYANTKGKNRQTGILTVLLGLFSNQRSFFWNPSVTIAS